jgi:chromosome segregation ATPase
LQKRLETINQDLRQRQDSIQSREDEINKLVTMNDELAQALDDAIMEKQALEIKLEKFSGEYIKVEGSLPDHIQKVKNTLESRVKLLEKDMRSAQIEISEKNAAIGAYEKKINTLSDQLNSEKDENEQLLTRVEKLNRQILENTESIAQNSSVSEQSLIEQISMCEDNIEEKTRELHLAKNGIIPLQNQVQKLEQVLEEKESTNEVLSRNITRFDAQNLALQKKIENLTAELIRVKQDYMGEFSSSSDTTPMAYQQVVAIKDEIKSALELIETSN